MATYIVLAEADWTVEQVEDALGSYGGCKANKMRKADALYKLKKEGYDKEYAALQSSDRYSAFRCETGSDIDDRLNKLIFGYEACLLD